MSDTTQAWAEALGRQSVLASPVPLAVAQPTFEAQTTGMDLKVRQLLERAQQQQQQPSVLQQGTGYRPDMSRRVVGGTTAPALAAVVPMPAAASGGGGEGPSFRQAPYDASTDAARLRMMGMDMNDDTGSHQGMHDDRRMKLLQSIARNRIFLSAITGVIVVFILMMINPPFIQKRTKNRLYRSGPDVGKLLLYGGVASGIVLVVPLLIQHRGVRSK